MDNFEALQETVGYKFNNLEYLRIALTHSSFSNEMKINKCENYERQEFLGDAVLELVSSDYIYREHPKMPEGNLTKLRAALVCEPALAYCARELMLDRYIRLGKGEELSGGRNRDSILCDVCEAVIGAIYLDGGFEPAKTFIDTCILDGAEDRLQFIDAKSILQQKVQAKGKTLEYVLISESGPDHKKEFLMEVRIDGEAAATAAGSTKKSAEQNAAYEVLRSNKCI